MPSAPAVVGVRDMTVGVADLKEATDFFTSFFGAEVIAKSGPFGDPRRSSMREMANVDVRAVVRESILLRTPFLNLRLLDASYPGRRELWPGMLDIGGWHLAGYVDDMDDAMEFVDAAGGVYVLGPGKKPTTNGPEVGEGSWACHCMTSWGMHFELLTYPNGRAYMSDYDTRLWNPADPDRGATARVASGRVLPGFRGFEHLSVAVADVEEAASFLEAVLGCERFYDMGPVEDRTGSGFGAYANVDVRVRVAKVRLLRTPYLNLELIEPDFPGQHRDWPHPLDVGGWQLTVTVGDIDAAVERALAGGAHVLGAKRPDGPGWRVTTLAPFGLYLELLQEAGSGPEAAWDPARPGS